MKIPFSLYQDNPAWPLLPALISYWGTTDALGTPITIVCGDLANEPSYAGHTVGLLDGLAAGQSCRIGTHVGNTLTLPYAFTNPAGAPTPVLAGTRFVILKDAWGLDIAAILAAGLALPTVQEVVIYPVAEDAAATEIADDGSAPAYYPVAAPSTNAVGEGAAVAAWVEDINFEQVGAISIISIYCDWEWQSRFLLGLGNGAQSRSKIQMSGDGGATWADVTDNFNNALAVMTNRHREGVGVWVALNAGANQLRFRLVHWVDAGNGISTSECQIRSNSYLRISYRKS